MLGHVEPKKYKSEDLDNALRNSFEFELKIYCEISRRHKQITYQQLIDELEPESEIVSKMNEILSSELFMEYRSQNESTNCLREDIREFSKWVLSLYDALTAFKKVAQFLPSREFGIDSHNHSVAGLTQISKKAKKMLDDLSGG